MSRSKSAKTKTYTIPANSQLEVGGGANFVFCDYASEEFFIAIDYGDLMEFYTDSEHISDEVEGFKNVSLINKTASQITVKMVIGFGRYKRNRVNISGVLEVENKDGTQLAVKNDDATSLKVSNKTGEKLQVQDSSLYGRVSSILGYMNDGVSLKNGVTAPAESGSSSYASSGTAGTTTVVSAGANTNGIKIYKASCLGFFNKDYGCCLKLGSDVLCGTDVINSGTYTKFESKCENMVLESGKELSIELGVSATGHAFAYVWYEVL